MPAHEYEVVRRIALGGGQTQFAARSVDGDRVNVANLPNHGSVGKSCPRRDDRIGASGEGALISRGSE
jgi:hypothetical protein